MIGNSVTFFGLINKYFLTTFYFIANAQRGQEFLALFYIFKIIVCEMYCIVLNKFYCILFRRWFKFKI